MTWWHFFLIGGAAGSSVQVAIDWWYTLITLRHPAILGFELNGRTFDRDRPAHALVLIGATMLRTLCLFVAWGLGLGLGLGSGLWAAWALLV